MIISSHRALVRVTYERPNTVMIDYDPASLQDADVTGDTSRSFFSEVKTEGAQSNSRLEDCGRTCKLVDSNF